MKQSIHMRPSKVMRLLSEGKTANSIKLNVSNAKATEIAAIHGFDCIWTDMEHVANDWSDIEKQVYVAKLYDCDLIVRVARGSYSDYIHPLELDATGVMVPHVMSAEDAAQVVRNVRFAPLGMRPVDGGNADGKYCLMPFGEYIAGSNREKLVILQIEDPQAVEDIERICRVPGFDIVYFGPGDLSQALGIPGQINHPNIVKARQKVAEAARKHCRHLGTVSTPDMIPALLEEGYRFINLGGDVHALSCYYMRMMAAYQNISIG